MHTSDHEKLLRDIEELRRLVAMCSTEATVAGCNVYWLRRNSITDAQGFMSAARQWSFLLGLMLTTPEPLHPQGLGTAAFDRWRDLLEKIFSAYAWAYFPKPDETLSEEWKRTREVAMPAFLAYFNQGFLATTDQVAQRITRYISPFDEHLQAELGLSATKALEICHWLANSMQEAADDVAQLAHDEKAARLALLERARLAGWEEERLRSEIPKSHYGGIAIRLYERMNDIAGVRLQRIQEHFGTDPALAFWRLFSVGRGELDRLTYPTEANLAEERALYRIDAHRALCPLGNQLFLAVLNRYERFLSSGCVQESFLRRRDATLESEVEASFRSLLGSEATYCPRVFETALGQYEHDLVIRLGRRVVIVEAKASPPVEPFRDPDRAFVRIRRAFQSDCGIQHAFDQGRRLWRRWASRDTVHLYDDHQRLVCEFAISDVDELFLVCATRDNFGILATDLSLLLEKEPNEPYPWCVNAIDLDAIADAWRYFSWKADRFFEFLRTRVTLHGHAACSEELEMVGYFIEHGGLHWLTRSKVDRIWLAPTYSDVFDRIYMTQFGEPPVKYKPHPPVMSDLREQLKMGKSTTTRPMESRARRKQGRNDLCACGSGRKYKRCCAT